MQKQRPEVNQSKPYEKKKHLFFKFIFYPDLEIKSLINVLVEKWLKTSKRTVNVKTERRKIIYIIEALLILSHDTKRFSDSRFISIKNSAVISETFGNEDKGSTRC